MKRAIPLLSALGLVLFLILLQNPNGVFSWPLFGSKNFTLQDLNGETHSLSDYRGKPVVVNFWASWCGPCKLEAPELVKLHEQYEGQIQILAVNLTKDDTVEGARRFAEEYGFQFPVLLDEEGEVAKKYQITAIPTTYFIDAQGEVVEKVLGFANPETLHAQFARLVQ